MGSPAWVFQHHLQSDFGVVFFPLQMLLVVCLFVPFMARLRLYTIYEYLEMRFNVSARLLASSLFVLVPAHLAFTIYAQSLALSLLLHLPFVTCIWISGAATTLYTVFGGIQRRSGPTSCSFSSSSRHVCHPRRGPFTVPR